MKLFIDLPSNAIIAMSEMAENYNVTDTIGVVDFDCQFEEREFYKYIYDPATKKISVDENAIEPVVEHPSVDPLTAAV